MADIRRLAELGMVPPLAKEVAAQITSGVGDKRRLTELSMVTRLASEVSTQITTKVTSVRRLAELSMPPVLAKELVAQIQGGGGDIWPPAGSAFAADFVNQLFAGSSGISVTRSTTAKTPNAAGGLDTVAIDTPRYAYDELLLRAGGLLVEGASANKMLSPDFAGAVSGTAGSGGALPTGWTKTANVGGIATVYEVGADYFALKGSGTPNATGVMLIFGSGTGTSGIDAGAAETYVMSEFARVLKSTGTTIGYGLRSYDAAGAQLASAISVLPGQADKPFPIICQRTTPASTAKIAPVVASITMTSGTPIDYEIRIYRPQLELSPARSTFQPSASRAAETVVPNAAFTSILAGDFAVQIDAIAPMKRTSASLLDLSDGTANNRVELYMSSGMLKCRTISGGVTLSDVNIGRLPILLTSRIALAKTGTELRAAVNGKDAKVITVTAPPLNTAKLGSGTAGAWNSLIQRLVGYAAAKTAAEVKALSAKPVFFDDFDRADGAPGTAPTGQAYTRLTTNGTGSLANIVSGELKTTDSGQSTTAAYTYVDLGSPRMVNACQIRYPASGNAGSLALLIQTPTDGLDVNTVVKGGSVHPSFGTGGYNLQYFQDVSTLVDAGAHTYQNAALRDGVSVYDYAMAYLSDGSVIAVLADGDIVRDINAPVPTLLTKRGKNHLFEHIWATGQAQLSCLAWGASD